MPTTMPIIISNELELEDDAVMSQLDVFEVEVTRMEETTSAIPIFST